MIDYKNSWRSMQQLTELKGIFLKLLSLLWISVLGLLCSLIHQMSITCQKTLKCSFCFPRAQRDIHIARFQSKLSKAQKYSVNDYIRQRTAGHHHINAASVNDCLALVLKKSTNCLISMCFHFFLKRYYWMICLHLHWLLINMCKFSIKGDVSIIPTQKHLPLKTKSHCLLFYKQHLHRP